MAELDYIDSLSNKDLRTECLKHGLPNVPVTDSSRKLLVRRLRAAIDGEPLKSKGGASKKAAPRRETVSVSQQQSPQHVEILANDYGRTASDHRRSYNNNQPSSPITKKRQAQLTPNPFENSRERSFTRSPSLSKSEVVTTSYRQELEGGKARQPLATVFNSNYENELPASHFLEEVNDNYSYSSRKSSAPSLGSDASSFAYSLYSTRSNRSVSLSKSAVVTTSFTQEIEPGKNDYGKDTEEMEDVVADEIGEGYLEKDAYDKLAFAPRQKPPYSYKNFEISPPQSGHQFASPPSKPLRHSMDAPTATSSPLYPSLNNFYEDPFYRQEEAYEADDTGESSSEEDQDEEVEELPFKSEFTRSLERSKVDGTFVSKVGLTSNTSAAYIAPKPRKSTHAEVDKQSALFQFFTTLDREYHLKQYIYAIGVFMLAVFLYVLFT